MSEKVKKSLLFILFILVGILFMFNLYWQIRFSESYSTQITSTKTFTVKTHGNVYYVNHTEYKNNKLLDWIVNILFASVIITIFFRKYKADPKYFSFKNKSQ